MTKPGQNGEARKPVDRFFYSPLRRAAKIAGSPIRRLMAAAFLPLGVASCQSTGTASFAVPAGVARQLSFVAAVNEDCSSLGDTEVRVTRRPEHGAVDVRSAPGHTGFPDSNPRHACNTRTVPGQQVWYTPAAAIFGNDRVDLETIYPNGGDVHASYSIVVR
jgi:hypothetical protein